MNDKLRLNDILGNELIEKLKNTPLNPSYNITIRDNETEEVVFTQDTDVIFGVVGGEGKMTTLKYIDCDDLKVIANLIILGQLMDEMREIIEEEIEEKTS